MIGYEYKVIPAPAKGKKAPGIKGAEARFAHTLEEQINDLASRGWEYQRSDILPSEERQGLTSTQIVYRSVLVFRRKLGAAAPEEEAPAPPVAFTRKDPPISAEPKPETIEEAEPPESETPAESDKSVEDETKPG